MAIRPINSLSGCGVASVREFFLLLLIGTCTLMSGCDGPKVSWTAESRSPDAKLVATARTVETSGIGTGDPGTFVFLNWTSGSQSPTIILALSPVSESTNGTVEMNWLTPNHLELAYKGRRTVDFQAIKWHGVDVTLREIRDTE